MKIFLEKGGQTRGVELDFSKLLEELERDRVQE
jgi:hypothetical protein